MPRNGSGVFSLEPGYLAVTGQTITASQHNPVLEDIESVLNEPQPISKGGTNATTASAARANLGITELSQPSADRIYFYDSSAGAVGELEVGTGLAITGTVLTAMGLSDGDKGDITVSASGTVWTIDSGVVGTDELVDAGVTFAKLAAAMIVTEGEGISSNDNDTTLPTSAAVKDYVDSVSASTTAGAVGSYAFLNDTVSRNTSAGTTRSGADLRYASAAGSESGTPSGTWRCMGYSVGGGSQPTLWVRIS